MNQSKELSQLAKTVVDIVKKNPGKYSYNSLITKVADDYNLPVEKWGDIGVAIFEADNNRLIASESYRMIAEAKLNFPEIKVPTGKYFPVKK